MTARYFHPTYIFSGLPPSPSDFLLNSPLLIRHPSSLITPTEPITESVAEKTSEPITDTVTSNLSYPIDPLDLGKLGLQDVITRHVITRHVITRPVLNDLRRL